MSEKDTYDWENKLVFSYENDVVAKAYEKELANLNGQDRQKKLYEIRKKVDKLARRIHRDYKDMEYSFRHEFSVEEAVDNASVIAYCEGIDMILTSRTGISMLRLSVEQLNVLIDYNENLVWAISTAMNSGYYGTDELYANVINLIRQGFRPAEQYSSCYI